MERKLGFDFPLCSLGEHARIELAQEPEKHVLFAMALLEDAQGSLPEDASRLDAVKRALLKASQVFLCVFLLPLSEIAVVYLTREIARRAAAPEESEGTRPDRHLSLSAE